jgi:Zn-dependent protease with chaperone function
VSNPLLSPSHGFVGGIEPTPVTGKYKLGLFLVALSMVLVLAVYFGLIILAGYGVYYQLAHFSQVMEIASHNFFTLFGWLLVPVAGLVLIFFLVKPFVAGRPPEPDRYTLTPKSDPELFAVISKVCELVKAPLPSRVDVDCRINASMHLRNGWRSLKENDVVLTIGLPLVAGMNMQEFVGVLAHESGHFRQGAGVRLTYIIRAINGWLARVVYERDDWDIWLAGASQRIDFRIAIFIHLIRLLIWLSRRVLWALMHLGNLAGGFMLRQMEFDADTYEIKVAGSAAFAEAMNKLEMLNAASVWADVKMRESWRSRRLPENVVRFISQSIKNVPPDLQKQIDEAAAKNKTSLFASHPSQAARIRAAHAMSQPGVFHLTEPASKLFNGFSDLCKGATRFHYASTLELRVKDENLVPNEASEREDQSLAEGESGLQKFFGGVKLKYRPILISSAEPVSATITELTQQICHARQAMEQSLPEVIKANREYEEAEALLQRGLDAIKNQSQTATERAEALMRNLAPTLGTFEAHAQTRLTAALHLLHHPEIQLENLETLRKEVDQLTVVFRGIGEIFPSLQDLRRKAEAFLAASHARCEQSLAKAAQARMSELEPELRELMKGLKQWLKEVPYPFDPLRNNVTLAEFARSQVPAEHKLEAFYNDCASHVNRLLPLYQRVLGRLAFIALTVEQTIPNSSAE